MFPRVQSRKIRSSEDEEGTSSSLYREEVSISMMTRSCGSWSCSKGNLAAVRMKKSVYTRIN